MSIVALPLPSPRRAAPPWLGAALIALLAVGSVGCAHAVRIEADPPGARVTVDGDVVGRAPVTVRRTVFVGDQLRVAVTADGYEPATVIVPASEWSAWPAAVACTPALGVPLAVPFAIGLLPLCGAGLVVGPAVAVGWALVTSPTLLALGAARKYPDVVKVKLRRRDGDPLLLPGELFYLPADVSPNPPPLSRDDAPRTTTPAPPQAGDDARGTDANPLP